MTRKIDPGGRVSSSIAWLDTTAEEQRKTRELIALFTETESRDELGIGQIRDAFSELLFPGFSVLQTRARYYLFIPWCFTSGPAATLVGPRRRAKAEEQERHVIKTLRDAGLPPGSGLIGGRAGAALKTLPSTMYWSGLLRHRVLRRDVDPSHLGLQPQVEEESTELASRVVGDWDGSIPQPPRGFPREIPGAFNLTREEAEWLAGQMKASAPSGGILAKLLSLRVIIPDDVVAPWQKEIAEPGEFAEVDHAELFAISIWGAALLYNLLVAERYEKNPDLNSIASPVEAYRNELSEWHEEWVQPRAPRINAWDLDEMWRLALDQNPNIARTTKVFVNHWLTAVKEGKSMRVVDSEELRNLVRDREKRKGRQSRLANDKVLATWSGSSGTALLTYRWRSVRSIVNDIVEGLASGASA